MRQLRRSTPWSLTEQQVRVLRAVCEHGCNKLAAHALGVELKTLERMLWLIKPRMPEHRTRLARILAFDRWDRARGGAAP